MISLPSGGEVRLDDLGVVTDTLDHGVSHQRL